MKIVALVGSFRKGSLNQQLAKEAKRLVEEKGHTFEILDYQDIPMFNEDLEVNELPAIRRVRVTLDEADGVWIFTPEYNHFFPPVLKNVLDWVSRPRLDRKAPPLKGKPVAISGITPALAGTVVAQDFLVLLLSVLNASVMTTPRLMVPQSFTQVDDQGHLALTNSKKYLAAQADAFLSFIEK